VFRALSWGWWPWGWRGWRVPLGLAALAPVVRVVGSCWPLGPALVRPGPRAGFWRQSMAGRAFAGWRQRHPQRGLCDRRPQRRARAGWRQHRSGGTATHRGWIRGGGCGASLVAWCGLVRLL